MNGPDELLEIINDESPPPLHWAKIKEGLLRNIEDIKEGVQDKVKSIKWYKRKAGIGTGGATFKELMTTIDNIESELNHFSIRGEFLSHYFCAFQTCFNNFATKKFIDKETSYTQKILHPDKYRRGDELSSMEECQKALLTTGFFREQNSMVDNLLEIYRLTETYLRQDTPGGSATLTAEELTELNEPKNLSWI